MQSLISAIIFLFLLGPRIIKVGVVVGKIITSGQRRAFKIITGGIVRTATNNLCNEIRMENLRARRDRNVLLFFSKIIHNMVPSYSKS